MHAVQVVSNANIYNFYPPPQKNILFNYKNLINRDLQIQKEGYSHFCVRISFFIVGFISCASVC